MPLLSPPKQNSFIDVLRSSFWAKTMLLSDQIPDVHMHEYLIFLPIAPYSTGVSFPINCFKHRKLGVIKTLTLVADISQVLTYGYVTCQHACCMSVGLVLAFAD